MIVEPEINYKQAFECLARQFIKRKGIEELLQQLSRTDFYTTPASTKYHDSEEHGLVLHSMKVFSELDTDLNNSEYDKESIAIVALFHDICKIGFYKTEMRNTKDEFGKWTKVPYYTVDDAFPYGHGEKSVYLLQKFLTLSDEEAMAIRWHMGLSEPKELHNSVSKAFEMFPLALYLHIADMKASYIK